MLPRAAVVTPPHLLRDYFHEPVLVLRVANLDDVLSYKAELDPPDREALRKRVRQRVCHSGFLRERKTVEELLGSKRRRRL